MDLFKRTMGILSELFERDFQFTLATVTDNVPSIRVVDTYYKDEAFWIVTYAKSNKVKDIENNPYVALCNNFYSFKGRAYNVGHPLNEENLNIREQLIKAFESWYFKHNNEEDMNMCYVKVELTDGFFHKDGIGYKVDFSRRTVEEFPFAPDVVVIS